MSSSRHKHESPIAGQDERGRYAAIAASSAWFRSLPPGLQAWLVEHSDVRVLHAGQRLFARGDAPDGIYAVADGAVRITSVTEGGQEALLAVIEAPQWFGEIALFDGAPRTHDAWAETDTVLLHVAQHTLATFLQEQPAHWPHFGRLLTQKLRSLFTAVEDMVLLPPKHRVARRLVHMSAGYGARVGQTRELAVSQEQLGLMLALSRQTVNQALKELEADGAILRRRGVIEILDTERLLQDRS